MPANKNDDKVEAANSSFFCGLCKLEYGSEEELEEHSWSLLHHKKLDKEKGRDYVHQCSLCDEAIFGLLAFTRHIHSEKHQKNLQERKIKNLPPQENPHPDEEEISEISVNGRETYSNLQGNNPVYPLPSRYNMQNNEHVHWSSLHNAARPRMMRFGPMRPPFPRPFPRPPLRFNQMNVRPIRFHQRFDHHNGYSDYFVARNMPQRFRFDSENNEGGNTLWFGMENGIHSPVDDANFVDDSDGRYIEGNSGYRERFQGFNAVKTMKEKMQGLSQKRPRSFTNGTENSSKKARTDKCTESSERKKNFDSDKGKNNSDRTKGKIISDSNERKSSLTAAASETKSNGSVGSFTIMSRTTENLAHLNVVKEKGNVLGPEKSTVDKSLDRSDAVKKRPCPFVSDDEEESLAMFVTENLCKKKDTTNELSKTTNGNESGKALNIPKNNANAMNSDKHHGKKTASKVSTAVSLQSTKKSEELTPLTSTSMTPNSSSVRVPTCTAKQPVTINHNTKTAQKVGTTVNLQSTKTSAKSISSTSTPTPPNDSSVRVSACTAKQSTVLNQNTKTALNVSTAVKLQLAKKLAKKSIKGIYSTSAPSTLDSPTVSVSTCTAKKPASLNHSRNTTTKVDSLISLLSGTPKSTSAQGKESDKSNKNSSKKPMFVDLSDEDLIGTSSAGSVSAVSSISISGSMVSIASSAAVSFAVPRVSSKQQAENTRAVTNIKGEGIRDVSFSSSFEKSIMSLDESLRSLSDSNQCEFLYKDGRRCPSNTDKKFCPYHQRVLRVVHSHITQSAGSTPSSTAESDTASIPRNPPIWTESQKTTVASATKTITTSCPSIVALLSEQSARVPSAGVHSVTSPSISTFLSSVQQSVLRNSQPCTSLIETAYYTDTTSGSETELHNDATSGSLTLSRFRYLNKTASIPTNDNSARNNLPFVVRKILKRYGSNLRNRTSSESSVGEQESSSGPRVNDEDIETTEDVSGHATRTTCTQPTRTTCTQGTRTTCTQVTRTTCTQATKTTCTQATRSTCTQATRATCIQATRTTCTQATRTTFTQATRTTCTQESGASKSSSYTVSTAADKSNPTNRASVTHNVIVSTNTGTQHIENQNSSKSLASSTSTTVSTVVGFSNIAFESRPRTVSENNSLPPQKRPVTTFLNSSISSGVPVLSTGTVVRHVNKGSVSSTGSVASNVSTSKSTAAEPVSSSAHLSTAMAFISNALTANCVSREGPVSTHSSLTTSFSKRFNYADVSMGISANTSAQGSCSSGTVKSATSKANNTQGGIHTKTTINTVGNISSRQAKDQSQAAENTGNTNKIQPDAASTSSNVAGNDLNRQAKVLREFFDNLKKSRNEPKSSGSSLRINTTPLKIPSSGHSERRKKVVDLTEGSIMQSEVAADVFQGKANSQDSAYQQTKSYYKNLRKKQRKAAEMDRISQNNNRYSESRRQGVHMLMQLEHKIETKSKELVNVRYKMAEIRKHITALNKKLGQLSTKESFAIIEIETDTRLSENLTETLKKQFNEDILLDIDQARKQQHKATDQINGSDVSSCLDSLMSSEVDKNKNHEEMVKSSENMSKSMRKRRRRLLREEEEMRKLKDMAKSQERSSVVVSSLASCLTTSISDNLVLATSGSVISTSANSFLANSTSVLVNSASTASSISANSVSTTAVSANSVSATAVSVPAVSAIPGSKTSFSATSVSAVTVSTSSVLAVPVSTVLVPACSVSTISVSATPVLATSISKSSLLTSVSRSPSTYIGSITHTGPIGDIRGSDRNPLTADKCIPKSTDRTSATNVSDWNSSVSKSNGNNLNNNTGKSARTGSGPGNGKTSQSTANSSCSMHGSVTEGRSVVVSCSSSHVVSSKTTQHIDRTHMTYDVRDVDSSSSISDKSTLDSVIVIDNDTPGLAALRNNANSAASHCTVKPCGSRTEAQGPISQANNRPGLKHSDHSKNKGPKDSPSAVKINQRGPSPSKSPMSETNQRSGVKSSDWRSSKTPESPCSAAKVRVSSSKTLRKSLMGRSPLDPSRFVVRQEAEETTKETKKTDHSKKSIVSEKAGHSKTKQNALATTDPSLGAAERNLSTGVSPLGLQYQEFLNSISGDVDSSKVSEKKLRCYKAFQRSLDLDMQPERSQTPRHEGPHLNKRSSSTEQSRSSTLPRKRTFGDASTNDGQSNIKSKKQRLEDKSENAISITVERVHSKQSSSSKVNARSDQEPGDTKSGKISDFPQLQIKAVPKVLLQDCVLSPEKSNNLKNGPTNLASRSAMKVNQQGRYDTSKRTKETSMIASQTTSDEEKIIAGYGNAVTGIKIHKDMICTCGPDNLIRVHCDRLNEVSSTTLIQCKRPITCIEIASCDEEPRLFVGSNERRVECFSLKTLRGTHNFLFNGYVTCMHSAFGNLYVGLSNGYVSIISLKTNESTGSFFCHPTGGKSIKCIVSTKIHPEKRYIIVGASKKNIAVHEFLTSGLVKNFSVGKELVSCLEVSGSYLFCGSVSGDILMYDLKKMKLSAAFGKNVCGVRAMKKVNELLLVASNDYFLRCYDIKSKQLIRVYGGNHQVICCLAVGDKNRIYSGDKSGLVKSFKISSKYHTTCEWENCGLPFTMLSRLKIHIIDDHFNFAKHSANSKVFCKWKSCLSCFNVPVLEKNYRAAKENIEAHVEKHLTLTS